MSLCETYFCEGDKNGLFIRQEKKQDASSIYTELKSTVFIN